MEGRGPEKYKVTIEHIRDGVATSSVMSTSEELYAAMRCALIGAEFFTPGTPDETIAKLVCEHNSWKGDGEEKFDTFSMAAAEFLKDDA